MEEKIFCFNEYGYYGVGSNPTEAYINLKREAQSVGDHYDENEEDYSDVVVPDPVIFIRGTQITVTPKIVFE